MSRRDTLLLLVLSAIWGASFLFIKVGVDVLEPSVVALGRVAIGALLLLALLPRGGESVRSSAISFRSRFSASFNNAVPFWLLGFAETSTPFRSDGGDPGVRATLHRHPRDADGSEQRVSGVRLARCRHRIRRRRLPDRPPDRWRSRRRIRRRRGRSLLRVLRAVCRPDDARGAGAAGVVRSACVRHASARPVRARATSRLPYRPRPCCCRSLALGALGSGIAYLLYFSIIASAGASRAILVTYLVPAIALVYGALFLDEAVTIPCAHRPRR